jgi:hypothetical protein
MFRTPVDVAELAREYATLPRADAESFARTCVCTIRRSRNTSSASRYARGDADSRCTGRIAYRQDAAADGVRYIDALAPILNVRADWTSRAAVEALVSARAAAGLGSSAGIICALRTMEHDVSRELAHLAVAYRGRGVVGFDLAGEGPPGFASCRRLPLCA